MKKSKNRRKLNNHGMSLIEVLVAIMILAIVTGPLLQSLVTGIKLNARAKENQRLTTAAQSIMEGLKAYDVEHICMQFNGWGMRLIANASSYYEEPISDRNGDGTFDVSIDPLSGDFLPASDGRYAFVLEGVKFDGMEGIADKFYDARIDISPNTVWNSSLEEYGKVGLIDVVDMNEYLDAVYKQPANMDQSMYALIVQNLLDELNDKNESGDVLELHDLEIMTAEDHANLRVDKIITVTVNEGGDSSISIVTIETKYVYEATGFTYTNAAGDEQELVGFSGEEFSADSGTVVYNNTNTAANGARLENVYLYYYPAYPRYSSYSSAADPTTISTEKIILQNNTSEKNFYLIKQIDNSISHANLSVYENKYSVNVTGSGAITLYHNLKEDLSSGNTLFTPSISGVTEGASGSMIGNTQEILLYNVKISLYEDGAAAAGFPPELLLLELNGTMND